MTEGTESLRKETYRLLQEFKLMAEKKTATDLHKNEAKTAQAIVEVAEESSRLVRLFHSDPRWALAEQGVRSMETAIANELSAEGRERYMPAINAVLGKTLGEMRTEQNEVSEQLEQCEWNGWNKACQQLRANRTAQAELSNKITKDDRK